MRNKKIIIFIVALIVILFTIFFFQKSLITDFSLEPERIELLFNSKDETLSYILSEEEYISERYNIDYEYKKDNICSIFIQKPLDDAEEFFKEKFIDYLKIRIPELNEQVLNIADYSHVNRVLRQWHRGVKLFIASLLFILIAIIFSKRIKNINKFIRKELDLYYLKEILSLKLNEILEETIKLVLLIFGGIFLLRWIIKFQFNIPGKYLPVSDIFDFEFYRLINGSIKMDVSSYGEFYYMTLNKVRLMTLGFLIIGIITFLLIIKLMNKKILEGSDRYGESSI